MGNILFKSAPLFVVFRGKSEKVAHLPTAVGGRREMIRIKDFSDDFCRHRLLPARPAFLRKTKPNLISARLPALLPAQRSSPQPSMPKAISLLFLLRVGNDISSHDVLCPLSQFSVRRIISQKYCSRPRRRLYECDVRARKRFVFFSLACRVMHLSMTNLATQFHLLLFLASSLVPLDIAGPGIGRPKDGSNAPAAREEGLKKIFPL